MHLTHIIVDDFLPDPDGVRRWAEGRAFPHFDKPTYFPGRNADAAIDTRAFDQQVAEVVHERLRPVPGSSHGKFRLALEGDQGSANVHIDNCHWSAMIYLTRNEHARGGTLFFRHKRTQTERAPVFPGDAEAMGYTKPTEVWDDILHPETNDLTKWEQTLEVPMRYNRLLLFRGYLWHNAGVSFGDSIANGRLILPLFYHAV